MLHKYGDLKVTDRMKEAVNIIQEEIKKIGFEKNVTPFWTEAVPNDRPHRRIDLVNGFNCDEYEFETDHTIQKEGSITIHI